MAAGGWQLAAGKLHEVRKMNLFQFISFFGNWRLAAGGWQTARSSMDEFISIYFLFWQLAAGKLAAGKLHEVGR